jgi:uncharacterized protein
MQGSESAGRMGHWADRMRKRHEIWGDDPEEREAEAVVTEALSDFEIERRWHDHALVVPLKVVARFIGRNARRVAVTIVGVLLLVLGVVGAVLPVLQGWFFFLLGLAVLATEYVWAERLLKKAREKAVLAKAALIRRKQSADRDPPA